jgi:hypothetical protein
MRIDNLLSGGIIVNYVCSSACRHCLYRSSPRRDKGYMSPDTLARCLRKVRELGCRSMHIGGGEPLLHPDRLVEVLKCAAREGIAIDYIETNCSWHKDDARTRQTLKMLIDHGADTLMVSVDPFHNEYIPFARVRAVIEAAQRVGMRLFAWKMEFAPDILQMDENKRHSLDEYGRRFGQEYIADLPGRYGLTMNGRAIDTFAPMYASKPADEILARCRRPCQEMWQTSHFHIDLYGNYVFTSCVGMAVSCEDLGEDLDPSKYPHLQMLSDGGVHRLYEYAKEHFAFTPRNAYVNKCDLCQHLRKHLVSCGVNSADLQPAEFYTIA